MGHEQRHLFELNTMSKNNSDLIKEMYTLDFEDYDSSDDELDHSLSDDVLKKYQDPEVENSKTSKTLEEFEDLSKTEKEIEILRNQIASKEKYAAKLREKLGMTKLDQISDEVIKGINNLRLKTAARLEANDSKVFQKASEALSAAKSNSASFMNSAKMFVNERSIGVSNLASALNRDNK